MKSEFITLASVVSLILLSTLVVAIDTHPVETGLPVTIIIGSVPGSNSTATSTTITISNPANINFQIVARDELGQSQNVNVSLYDDVGHDFLNNSQFTGLGYLYSPTSLSDFEFNFDNRNLGVMVNGLNLTGFDGTLSQITIEKVNPQMTNSTVYKAYKVELPSNFQYQNILLIIKLDDLTGINYGNISVYRCGSYNLVTNICSDPNGWQPQQISVDSTNQIVTLNINHFSVYAVGSGSASSQLTPTTTTTTQTTSATTSTSTSVATNNAASTSSNNGGGSDGSGGGILPDIQQTTTTTQTPTTTTTVLIIKRSDNSTSSSSSQTSQTAPIIGFLSLSNIISPIFVAAIVIVASVAAIFWIKNNFSFSGLNFSEKSYKPFPSRKTKKGKKSTELKLSL